MYINVNFAAAKIKFDIEDSDLSDGSLHSNAGIEEPDMYQVQSNSLMEESAV